MSEEKIKGRFISKKELAELLRLSTYTIDTWVSQKRIPYVKLGTRVVFDVKDIESWIEENKIKPGTGALLN